MSEGGQSESVSESDSESMTFWKRRNKYDSSSDGSRQRKKRKRKNGGWGHRRRRRRLSDCNENIIESAWYNNNWKESDDDSDGNNLSEVCLSYQVNKYEADCGELDALFLPLCNVSNSVNVTSNELNSIITKISPSTLSAQGIDLFDSVGILVRFNEAFVNEFVLCLSNVSVEEFQEKYFENDANKITVANRAAFRVDNVFEECSNNDGLPCLNFVFPSKCDNESDSDSSEEPAYIKANSALINYNLVQSIKSRTYWQLNPKWKTEIITIVSVLILLIIIAVFYLMYTAKIYQKYGTKTESVPQIAKLSDENHRKKKRKRVRRKRNGLVAVESETDYETDDHEHHE